MRFVVFLFLNDDSSCRCSSTIPLLCYNVDVLSILQLCLRELFVSSLFDSSISWIPRSGVRNDHDVENRRAFWFNYKWVISRGLGGSGFLFHLTSPCLSPSEIRIPRTLPDYSPEYIPSWLPGSFLCFYSDATLLYPFSQHFTPLWGMTCGDFKIREGRSMRFGHSFSGSKPENPRPGHPVGF